MEIYSVVRSQDEGLKKVKIQSTFNPGIPKVSVLGVKDKVSKEVSIKLQSALLNQGYQWEITNHLVLGIENVTNINEPYTDLSLAVEYLLKSQQIDFVSDKKVICLGELSLSGEILPINLQNEGLVAWEGELWVGAFEDKNLDNNKYINIKNLNDFKDIYKNSKVYCEDKKDPKNYTKKVEYLAKEYVELFEILTLGEHHALFLTPESPDILEFVKLIQENLEDLDPKSRSQVRYQKGKRPLAKLNPSISKSQMLGTSFNGKGLYYFAHGGMAYCNNFFGLSRSSLDTLNCLVQGGGFSLENNFRCQLVARNSLCPCGKAQVGRPRKCSYSLYKCRAVLERITYDDLTLFQVVIPVNQNLFNVYPEVSLEKLNNRRRSFKERLHKRNQKGSNAMLSLFELQRSMSERAKKIAYIPNFNGLDRTRSLLSVARTLADLEESKFIESEHINKSLEYSFSNVKSLMHMI